jgi:outer membrane protein assembly factor BamA
MHSSRFSYLATLFFTLAAFVSARGSEMPDTTHLDPGPSHRHAVDSRAGARPVDTTRQAPDAKPRKILEITIHGNALTRERLIRRIMDIEEGMYIDSSLAAQIEHRLGTSALFTRSKVFIIPRPQGCALHVLVSEPLYLSLSDMALEFFDRKQGENQWWWRASLAVSHNNFRGLMERLYLRASIWEHRSLVAAWSKRFPDTPWFYGFSAGITGAPHTSINVRSLSIHESATVGRFLRADMRLYGSLGGLHRRFYEAISDTGNPVPQVDHQMFLALGWRRDKRNRLFGTTAGTYFALQGRGNLVLKSSNGASPHYLQLDGEARAYHRGLHSGHTLAHRLRATLRVDTAGRYDGISAGGEGSLRGYSRDYLGNNLAAFLDGTSFYDFPEEQRDSLLRERFFIPHNRLLYTGEYRFSLAQMPSVEVPQLARRFYGGVDRLSYRIDGAVFADAALLWRRYSAMRYDPRLLGASAGIGLRAVAPGLQRGVSADFAWGLERYHRWERWKEYAGQQAERWDNWLLKKIAYASKYMPVAHFYFDYLF